MNSTEIAKVLAKGGPEAFKLITDTIPDSETFKLITNWVIENDAVEFIGDILNGCDDNENMYYSIELQALTYAHKYKKYNIIVKLSMIAPVSTFNEIINADFVDLLIIISQKNHMFSRYESFIMGLCIIAGAVKCLKFLLARKKLGTLFQILGIAEFGGYAPSSAIWLIYKLGRTDVLEDCHIKWYEKLSRPYKSAIKKFNVSMWLLKKYIIYQ